MATKFGSNRDGHNETDAIFERYATQLIDFAREQLDSELCAKLDPEDVMQSTLRSFYRRHRNGDFELTSWESLWYLLAQIARRKCFRAERFHGAEKRDYQREHRQDSVAEDSRHKHWEINKREPCIEDVVALRDTVTWLMQSLEPKQREIVNLHLQGVESREIAGVVARSQRTVRRTLRLVRDAIHEHHSEFRVHVNRISE